MSKIFSIFIIACIFSVSINAQVKFKLIRQDDHQTYTVSMIPEKTYEGNQNITGTAQVTLKIGATNDFIIRKITSLQPETAWVNNATISKPALAPEFTYVSFGMQSMAHNAFKYKKGSEILLFSFKNVGDIKAQVSLLNNDLDIMAQSVQKTKYNIKNYISVIGHGLGNAYIGNIEPVQMLPEDALRTYVQIQNLYPNPAADKVTISWENQLEDTEDIKKLEVLIYDVTGIEKIRKLVSSNSGKHSQEIQLLGLKSGTYFVKLQRDEKYFTNTQQLVVFE